MNIKKLMMLTVFCGSLCLQTAEIPEDDPDVLELQERVKPLFELERIGIEWWCIRDAIEDSCLGNIFRQNQINDGIHLRKVFEAILLYRFNPFFKEGLGYDDYYVACIGRYKSYKRHLQHELDAAEDRHEMIMNLANLITEIPVRDLIVNNWPSHISRRSAEEIDEFTKQIQSNMSIYFDNSVTQNAVNLHRFKFAE